jgi:hypothetical protein
MMRGLILCMCFQVPYGIWSGPGVEKFEHFTSAFETLAGVMSRASEKSCGGGSWR